MSTDVAQDAFILATLLAQPETRLDTLQRTLAVYDAVRRPFTQHIQDLSQELGEVLWMETPAMKHVSAGEEVPFADLEAMHARIVELHRWTWTTSLGADRDDAVAKVRDVV